MTVEQALEKLDPFGSSLLWRCSAILPGGFVGRAAFQWVLVDPSTMSMVFVNSVAEDLHCIDGYVDQIVKELLGDHSWRQLSRYHREQSDWEAGDKADLRHWLVANLRLLE